MTGTGSGLAWAALGFGLAALAPAWNPVSAPFGLLVGLPAALIALAALRRGVRRGVALFGLAAAVAAVGLAGMVLARTAGVGREATSQAIVPQPTRAEVSGALDAAAESTRPARTRAAGELDELGKRPAN